MASRGKTVSHANASGPTLTLVLRYGPYREFSNKPTCFEDHPDRNEPIGGRSVAAGVISLSSHESS
ncbi:Uncharacterised protein [Mycobacteroides abscessus subsp. abscessus]|nr:Uncharacterised protein [Mycobacteroides abscessus subsp. abscessus]SLL22657.1 Uncharacterised protein [Mycobacteroides abscessus subsp. abscessus]